MGHGVNVQWALGWSLPPALASCWPQIGALLTQLEAALGLQKQSESRFSSRFETAISGYAPPPPRPSAVELLDQHGGSLRTPVIKGFLIGSCNYKWSKNAAKGLQQK